MKIFLDQFCLANGEDELPKGLTINGKRQVQSVALLRGATAGVFPRGNRVNTVAFAVVRRHASIGAAEAFLCRHAARLPASGNLVLLCEEAEAGVVRYTAPASAVASDQGAQAEAVTTHRYTIVCGVIRGGEGAAA